MIPFYVFLALIVHFPQLHLTPEDYRSCFSCEADQWTLSDGTVVTRDVVRSICAGELMRGPQ